MKKKVLTDIIQVASAAYKTTSAHVALCKNGSLWVKHSESSHHSAADDRQHETSKEWENVDCSTSITSIAIALWTDQLIFTALCEDGSIRVRSDNPSNLSKGVWRIIN